MRAAEGQQGIAGRTLAAAALAAAAALIAVPGAGAATIRVTTAADELNANPDACSLREALWSANNDSVSQAPGCAPGSGADRITIPDGDYELAIAGRNEQGGAAGDLDITTPVAIEHRGTGQAAVDGKGLDRVFDVDGAVGTAVQISALVIRGGHAAGPPDATATGAGGGILVSGGALTLRRSTLTGNTADSWGGGIETRFGTTTNLVNTTVSGNRARRDGGGADNTGGVMSLINTTVTANAADSEGNFPGGGGIGNFGGGTTTIRNSIVAGNTDRRGLSPDCYSSGGTLGSQGQALIGSLAGCAFSSSTGDVTGVDPKLGPLADNGGPTPTHALLRGSPALGKGGSCEQDDQRGVPRTAGGACDIGAYELVRCHRRVVDRVGSDGDDVLAGTPKADAFLLLAGRDRAFGRGGGDRFCAGAGHDRLYGGSGRDRVYGDTGKDRLSGGGGGDLLAGGGGKDRLRGGRGDDRLRGDGGADRCNGGPGEDSAAGCERIKAPRR